MSTAQALHDHCCCVVVATAGLISAHFGRCIDELWPISSLGRETYAELIAAYLGGVQPAASLKNTASPTYLLVYHLVLQLATPPRWLQYVRTPWNEPTDDIKNYFGEKIGLYFLWLGHYTTWCVGHRQASA